MQPASIIMNFEKFDCKEVERYGPAAALGVGSKKGCMFFSSDLDWFALQICKN